MSNRIQSDRKFKRIYDIIKEVAKEHKVKLGTASEYMTHFINWQIDSLNKMESKEWLWSNFGSIYVDKRQEHNYDKIKEKVLKQRDEALVTAASEELQQVTEDESSDKTNNINNNN